MSQILISALTIQEINSALLRVQRSIKNNQASLSTNVNKIVSSGSSTIGGKYDDTGIIAQINALSASLSQALISVDKLDERVTDNEENIETNANNIASLQSLLSNINFTYDEETNTIHFTDINGDTTDIPLIDTTYDFAFDSNTHKLSVHNNLSDETVFDSVVDTTYNFSFDTTTHKLTIHNNMSGVDIFDRVVDTVYSFAWNNGTLTITDNRSQNPVATINFDNRYYTEAEIQALVLDLIPDQASAENQLADKAFVNSSIETNTATFRGTFDSVAELNAYSGPVDNNDYAFVKTLDAQSGLYQYDRYKWVTGNPGSWEYEYTINSSGFTAEQLAALNSGITANLVAKITDVYNCSIQINQNGTCKGSFTLNQSSNATLSLTDQLVKQTQLTASTAGADRNLFMQENGLANNVCSCIYVSCACPLTYNHKSGIIKSMNTDNWGSVYSGSTYSTGYYLLAQLIGSAATGNHDVTLYGTTFKNAAAIDYPTTFRVYVRGRCDTVSACSFKVDNECNDIYATYEVDTTNHKFTLRLYGCVSAYYTKYNTQISYTASGDVSARISTGCGCLTFPNTYFAEIPTSETSITKTPLTVMNATCFGGLTYAAACADIRSGLSSHDCLVKLENVATNANRDILQTGAGFTAGCICPVYSSSGIPLQYNACCGCLRIGDFSCNCCNRVYISHNVGLVRSGPKGSQINAFSIYKENNCLDNCSIGVGIGSGNINRGFFDYCKASETATTPTFRWLQYWDDTKEIHALPICANNGYYGELLGENKAVYSCAGPSSSGTKRYVLICFDKAYCGDPAGQSACFEIDMYSSKYYIWIDVCGSPITAWFKFSWKKNETFDRDGDRYGSVCAALADATANGNCFWLTYKSYRQPVIKSSRKISVICNTTTAPTGITFIEPTNRNSYINVYNGTTCVCMLQDISDLCLGCNAFNSTAFLADTLATSVKINGSDKTTISDVIATLDNTYQPKAYSFSCSSSHCRYIYLGSIPVSSGTVSYASLTMYLFGYNCQITQTYPIGTIQIDTSSGASATGFNIRGWSDIPLNSATSNTNSPRLYVRKDTTCSLYRFYLDSAYTYVRPKIQLNWGVNFTIGDFKCYASMTGDALWNSIDCKDIVYLNKINRFDVDTDGNICCAGYICGSGGSLVNWVFTKAANTVSTSTGHPVWRLIYDVTAWWNCAGTSSSNTSARGIVGRLEAYRNGGFGTSALVDIEAWTNYGRGSVTNPLNGGVLKLAYCYKGTNIVQPYIIKNITADGDKYYLALKQCSYSGVPIRFDGMSYSGKWLTTQICGVDADGTLPACWSIAISPVQCSAAALELYTTTPYIDFHVGNMTCDYTHRIIASPGTSTTTYGCLQFITSCVSYNTSTCVYACTEGNTFNMFPNGEFDAKFVKLGKGLATESAGRILAYGNKSTNEMICFLNNTNDVNGNGFSIGGGGIGIIGSGESANNVWCCINGSTNYFGACAGKEELYLASDNCITFITCANAADTTTWKYSYIDKDGIYHGDICGKSDCACLIHQTAFTSADYYWNIPLWSNSETYLPYRCLGCLGSLKACQDSSNKVTLNSDYFCGTLCGLAGCFCRCAVTSGTYYVALTGGTNAGCITGIWTSSACALSFAPATGQLSTTIGTFGSYTCAGSYMRAPIFMALGASGASKVCNVTIRACCTNASCTLTCNNWIFCGSTGDLWSTGYRTCPVSKSISFPKNATTYVFLGCFRNLQYNNENQLGIFASGSNLVNNGVLKWVGTNAAVNGQNNIELKMANYCNTSYGITGIGFIKTGTSWNCYTCVVLRICNANTSSDYSWVVGYFRNQIDCGGFSGEITCLGSTAPSFDCFVDIPSGCRNFTYHNGQVCVEGDLDAPLIHTECIYSVYPAKNTSQSITFYARCCNDSAIQTATMTFNPTGVLCVCRINNNGYNQKWQQTINLSSQSTSCFYPVTWPSGVTYETDIEIQSPSGSGSMTYNQNYIHFYERASGWNDMPKTIYVQTLSRYQDSENVFGCIGYGTGSSSYSVIWLRGGMNYTVNANVALTAHTSNVTCGTTGSSPSTYTVGTSLCGGTNTCVGVFANATAISGLYINNNVRLTGNLCAGAVYNTNGCAYILKCEVDACGFCKHDCYVKLQEASASESGLRYVLMAPFGEVPGSTTFVNQSSSSHQLGYDVYTGTLCIGRVGESPQTGCININGENKAAWYCTYTCSATYSLSANTTYYIKVGNIESTRTGSNENDITVHITGPNNNSGDKVKINWLSTDSCSDAVDSIKIDQSNWLSESGIQCVGWKHIGANWDGNNDIYLVVRVITAGSYTFNLFRNMLGGWTTSFSCTTTNPTLSCAVCTKPNGERAFHWQNGDTYIESTQDWKQIGSFTGTRSCNRYYMRLGSFHNVNPETCIKVVLSDASHCSTVYISTKGTCLDCGNWTYQIDNEGNDFILADTLQLQCNSTDTNAYLGILDSCSTGTICMSIYQKGNDLGFNPLVSTTSRYTNTLSGYSPISIVGKNLYGYTNFNNINANRVDSYVFTTTSALKCKCDITKPSRKALDIIDSLDIVEYRYKNEDKSEPKHIGIIADYTDELLSGKTHDQLRLADAVGLLLQAVKELKEERK